MAARRACRGRGAAATLAFLLLFSLGAAALAGPSAGAWEQFRGDAQKSGNVDDTAAPRATGWIFDPETGSQLVASPVTDGLTVVVADYQGELSGVDAFDGNLLWTRRTPEFVTATPAISGDLVLVPSGKSLLAYQVQPAGNSVALAWSFNASARIDSPPTVAGASAYFGSDDRNLYKVDLGTGALAWSYATRDVVKSSPAVHAGRVYVGSYDGSLYALEDNGSNVSLAWSFDTGGEVAGSPAVAGGVLYACTLAGRVFAIDADTGAKRWEAAPGGVIVASPAVVGGLLVVGGDTLAALDLQNGVTVWDRTLGGYVRSSPAASAGLVFVGDYAGRLYAFRPDGTLAWSYDTGSAIRTSPAVGGGLAYVGNDDGRLFGLPLDAGSPPEVQELPARETYEGVRETFAAVASDPEGRDLVYTWAFGDGATGAGRVASHTYGSAGNYTVEVTASDGQLTTKRSAVVTVLPFRSTVSGGSQDDGPAGGDTTALALGAAGALAAAVAGLVLFFRVRRGRPMRDEAATNTPPPRVLAPTPPARGPANPPAPGATGPAPAEFDYYRRAFGGKSPPPEAGPQPPRPPRGPRGPPP